MSFALATGAGALSCSRGDEQSDAAELSETEERGAWGVDGIGGALPVYGESTDSVEELKLTFKSLEGPSGGGATDIVFLPDHREMLMTLREGRLYHIALTDSGFEAIDRWDFEEEMLPIKACGPTNLLLDPDFVNNRFIYVTYCPTSLVTRLVRYEWVRGEAPKNPAVIFETEIGEQEEDGEWHRFGSMGWEDDDVMWFLLGDHKQEQTSQDVTVPHAGLHRIIPNRDPDGEGYQPAAGNMTDEVEGETPFESLYAYGLRSPWRGTRDRQGRYIVGDVGFADFEEVDLIDAPGQNFGWDAHEGPCESDCGAFVDPIVYYGREPDDPYVHDDPESESSELRAIWVGEIYQDPAFDRYQGLMNDVVMFGDLFTGWVRALRIDEEGAIIMNENVGHLTDVTQWKVGPDGYIYVVDLNGALYVALLED